MKIDEDNVGEAFQRITKYHRDDLPKGGPDWENRPPRHKEYERPLDVVELPFPDQSGGNPLWEVIAGRRTRRTYKNVPLGMHDISQLLWAANGKTREGREAALRAAPSAGALYPIELYVMANYVDGLKKGIYHYDVTGHSLALIREGEFGEKASLAALGQAMLTKAGAVVFMTAVVERCVWKYRQRAYRYIYLDAGHIGQNICLAGEALSLGVCPIGAFYDDELNGIIGVDGTEETLLYAMTVGR